MLFIIMINSELFISADNIPYAIFLVGSLFGTIFIAKQNKTINIVSNLILTTCLMNKKYEY